MREEFGDLSDHIEGANQDQAFFGLDGSTVHGADPTQQMVAENWKRVKEVFAVAVQQEPEARQDFLDRECSENRDLRNEVESLLDSFESADTFLESPAYVNADDAAPENDSLVAGQWIGHYEVVRRLGAGGMGEVYLARDSKLHRSVALKVLFKDVPGTEESRSLLMREACAAATLDHPNICAIFEINESEGRSFIVMQYVEGETLAQILKSGPLELEHTIDIGIQIADALDEAHSHRIIHRDIKPANIIVNEKGTAKVLDFGLAKFVESGPSADSAKRLSTSGAVMGTVPYMSPEQLRGRILDARTDIFSFGAVLYEMATGKQVFSEDNHAEAISAILNNEPDVTQVPGPLRPIIRKALMKDKRQRYASAGEIGRELRLLSEGKQSDPIRREGMWKWLKSDHPRTSPLRSFFSRRTASNDPSSSGFHKWKVWDSDSDAMAKATKGRTRNAKHSVSRPSSHLALYALAAIVLVTGTLAWYLWPRLVGGRMHSFDSLRSVRLVSWNSGGSSIYKDYSLSHDGKMIAFSSNQGGANEGIYIKQTADGKDLRITNDEWNDRGPIWSPNDQLIAFSSYRSGKSGIYSCPSLGGETSLLKIIGDGDLFLRKWSKDGTSLFYEFNGNLFRLDLSTKESQQLTGFSPTRTETRFFSVSPSETEMVYSDKSDGQSDLWLTAIDGGVPVRLTNDKDEEIRPTWHPDGRRVLYTVIRDNHFQINQVYTDAEQPDQITRGGHEYEIIGVSMDGARVFYLTWNEESDIWAVDTATGNERPVDTGVEHEFWSNVSPDGRSIVFQMNSDPYPPRALPDSRLVVQPLDGRGSTISFSGHNPHWLPDSQRISFVRWNEAEKKPALWTANVATGQEEKLSDNYVAMPNFSILPYNRAQIGEFSWSPDGKRVVFLSRVSGFSNILMTFAESKETVDLTQSKELLNQYASPLWSPDGDRLAFVSSQRPAGDAQPAIWRVWTWENGAAREIYSTRSSLRLLGWSGQDLLLESSNGPMKAGPIDPTLLRISIKGSVTAVSLPKSIYATSMTLSSDGKTAAFVSRQDDKDNLWLVSTAGGTARKITPNADSNLFYGSPAFSPDGKTIFFDKQKKLNTISMFENFN